MLNLTNVPKYKDEPYPFTELQEKCISDLETTSAPQAHGSLERVSGAVAGFCCLGRFCVVAGAKRDESAIYIVSYEYQGQKETAGLPDTLAMELRLSVLGYFRRSVALPGKHSFISLANMNDSGEMSFKEIAQYMRYDPWNVFDDPLPAAEPETNQQTAEITA